MKYFLMLKMGIVQQNCDQRAVALQQSGVGLGEGINVSTNVTAYIFYRVYIVAILLAQVA